MWKNRLQYRHTTERMAPNWMMNVKAWTKASPCCTPIRFCVMIMCPVEDTGRNSVNPSTMEMMMVCRRVIIPVPADCKSPFLRMIHPVRFYWLLFVGVLPAVVIGMAAKKSGLLDWLLDSVWVVAVMLVVGGVFMLFCDRIFNKYNRKRLSP